MTAVLASATLYAHLHARLPEDDPLMALAVALVCDEADDEITEEEEEQEAKRQRNHDRAADALDAV
jgi:hypothetical protein